MLVARRKFFLISLLNLRELGMIWRLRIGVMKMVADRQANLIYSHEERFCSPGSALSRLASSQRTPWSITANWTSRIAERKRQLKNCLHRQTDCRSSRDKAVQWHTDGCPVSSSPAAYRSIAKPPFILPASRALTLHLQIKVIIMAECAVYCSLIGITLAGIIFLQRKERWNNMPSRHTDAGKPR